MYTDNASCAPFHMQLVTFTCIYHHIHLPVHSVHSSSQKFQLEYVYSKLADDSVCVCMGGGGGVLNYQVTPEEV